MDRLFNRIGVNINNKLKSLRIGLIGCGSLGSSISLSLAKCGISNFTLIDHDLLTIENVPRHECNTIDASSAPLKVDALKLLITRHFPHIKCKEIGSDVLQLLLNDEYSLMGFDLIISATGNHAVERRLNSLAYEGKIKAPIAYIWMEPYGIAGNMLFINPSIKGCYNCCFNISGKYNYAVANQNVTYNIREAGCQISFMPYSHLSIQQFISIACRILLEQILNKSIDNFHFTWIGDKKLFHSLGHSVNERWAGNPSFSTYCKKIEPKIDCTICNK